jgi:phosphate:Na+ symporter
LQTRENIEKFCSRLSGLLQKEDSQSCLDELISIYRSTTGGYTDTLQQLYREGMDKKVNEIEITTLINFNREVFTAFKALIFGAKDYLLEQKQSAYFDELPGFIR